MMNNIELARVLTLITKMRIDNNPYLSKEEKEYLKQWADKAKEEIEKNNQY